MLREIEIAAAKLLHLTLDDNAVSLMVPTSKMDTTGSWTTRTLKCACRFQRKTLCPWHATYRHLRRVRVHAAFGNSQDFPLVPGTDGPGHDEDSDSSPVYVAFWQQRTSPSCDKMSMELACQDLAGMHSESQAHRCWEPEEFPYSSFNFWGDGRRWRCKGTYRLAICLLYHHYPTRFLVIDLHNGFQDDVTATSFRTDHGDSAAPSTPKQLAAQDREDRPYTIALSIVTAMETDRWWTTGQTGFTDKTDPRPDDLFGSTRPISCSSQAVEHSAQRVSLWNL